MKNDPKYIARVEQLRANERIARSYPQWYMRLLAWMLKHYRRIMLQDSSDA